MTTLDPTVIEQQVQNIENTDALVLKDVHRFPTIHSVVLPKMVISIVQKGTARLSFDYSEHHVAPNYVAIFPAKHIFSGLHTSEDYSATLVILSEKLVEDARLTSFSFNLQPYHIKPIAQLTETQVNRILSIVEMLELILQQKGPVLPHRHEALCSTLHILFEFLNAFRQEENKEIDNASRGSLVYIKFMDLLAAHYSEEHKVNFYAEKLCLTPKYMSKLIHDATGYGANAWIDQYILAKSKLLLISRKDLSVQAISQTLGFPEQASFTRFFRNLTGQSPREFRFENMR